ncbi:MAG: hypothetical protein EHM12_07995 [Dehalococcoidia bacterium]|nr:MAG: hypothetical protein EHM12_07995 [Dehalococcoidia bacterium]
MIFNKDGNGLREIRHYCQWVLGSYDFADLVNDIILAEEEVKNTVGAEVFIRAERHYLSSDYTFSDDIYHSRVDGNGNYYHYDSGNGSNSGSGSGSGDLVDINDMLVTRIQRVVALIAYREFSINNDLSHGPTGRRVMIDKENEQMAWEWMIERDDDGLVKKANRAFDRLIAFLDEQNISEWTGSDIYRQTKELILPDSKTFNDTYPIDNNRRLYLAMVPFIKENQRKYIKPLITTYYNDLMIGLRNNILGTSILKDIYELCKLPLALFTIHTAIKRLSMKLLPDAVVQEYKSSATGRSGSFPVKQSEKEQLLRLLYEDAIKELKPLETYIENLNTDSGSGSSAEEEEPKTIADRMLATNKFVRV